MRRRLYAGDHPDLAVGIDNLAVIRSHLGRHQEAEALFAEALAMRQRLFHGDHPAVAEALTNLASQQVSPPVGGVVRQAAAMEREVESTASPSAATGSLTAAATGAPPRVPPSGSRPCRT